MNFKVHDGKIIFKKDTQPNPIWSVYLFEGSTLQRYADLKGELQNPAGEAGICIYVSDDIVLMDSNMPLPRFWTKLKNWLENMFDVMARTKYLCSWKNVDNVKTETIPCDCDHHLFRLYHLLFHFLGWFVLPQPDNVVIC
jgi:hypothetical protein